METTQKKHERSSTESPRPRLKKRLFDLLRRRYVIAAIVLLVGGTITILGLRMFIGSPQLIDRSTYQVVYLSSSQTFFGKLQNTTGEYIVLRSPYTAQNTNLPSTGGVEGEQADTQLTKLTTQIYGPQDSIAFRKEQVLFWQNLAKDSKVVQAIKDETK